MDELILNNMLKDINKHKRNKNKLLEYYIQKRLKKSLKNYYKDLLETYNILSHKEPKKVFKTINRIEKEGK